MKKYAAFLMGTVVLFVVAFSLRSSAGGAAAGDGDDAVLPSGEAPQVTVTAVKPGHDRLAAAAAVGAADFLETLYFTPSDLTTTATILFITNTSNAMVSTFLAVYDIAGFPLGLWQIDIGAYDTARISSDQIVGSEGDWGYGVWISFGSNAASGTLDIPPSVVVDGYVVWNGLSGVFNPGTASFTLPLRFTSMP